MIPKFEKKKSFHNFVELVNTNPLIYNALRFTKYCKFSVVYRKMIPKFGKKKSFHNFVELVNTNPLIYNALKFDQYSHLAIYIYIPLNIFRF